jgi:hypothetical protein
MDVDNGHHRLSISCAFCCLSILRRFANFGRLEQFIVEAGTPNFVAVLISLLYSTMIIGVQLIRTRGDLREYWSSDKDSLAKDEATQIKHDKIIKWMKVRPL